MVDIRSTESANIEPDARGSETRSQGNQQRAEGELANRLEPPDRTKVSEDAVSKMQAESGLFGPGQGSFRDLRRTMDRTSNSGNVDRRVTTFDTAEGSKQGIMHTGKDGTFFTTAGGERFKYETVPGAEGKFNLTNSQTGRTTEVFEQHHEVNRINRMPEGPARVWRPGEQVTVTPNRAAEAIKHHGVRDAPPGASDMSSQPGKFDQSRAQNVLEQLQKEPRNPESRKAFNELATKHPNETIELLRQMKSEGQDLPGRAESWSKAFENRLNQGKNESPADGKISQAELKVQGEKATAASDQKSGSLKGESLSKTLGLESGDPAARQFINDLGKRLGQLSENGQSNVKLQDLLKGLDPQRANALETFLTQGKDGGGNLTLSQLEPGRLTSLRSLLSGKGDGTSGMPGGAEMGKAGLEQFIKQALANPSTMIKLDQSQPGNLTATFRDLGQMLNGLDKGSSTPTRLLDMLGRSLDAGHGEPGKPGLTILRDFQALMGPRQENLIKTLVESSAKLPGSIRAEGAAAAMDAVLMSTILPGMTPGIKGDAGATGDGSILNPQTVRGDAAAQASSLVSETLSGKPIDPVSGLPYDPHTGKLLDPATGREIGNVRPSEMAGKLSEKEAKQKELEDKTKEQEELIKDKKKEMLIMLQEQKERELKEKQLKEQKLAEEDKKRRRYVVKKDDTLESIAEKELRDLRLTALIYDINKKIIPTRIENEKEVIHLPRGLVIWLPSPAESREFRNKLMTGKIKPESDTSSGGTSGSKFASAEDELSARFGQQWDGTTNEGTSSPSPRDELIASSMAKADQRRKNIEAALGPIAPKKKKHADGKLRYVVRLGDSLKSIAMKHPAIKDVSLWKLIAEVNGLTTEVDQKGSPKATIARGSSILLPSYQEMAAHREKLGLTKAKLIGSNTKHGVDSEFASKKCPECSRLAVVRATICPCGHEFKETAGLNASKEKLPETTDSLKDAATIVLEAAGLIEKPGDKPPVKTIIDDQSKIPPVAQALNQHLIGAKTSMSDESGDTVFRTPEEHKDEPIIAKTWQVEHSLDEDVRLVKSAQSFAASEGALEVALEVKVEGIWSLMVNYQITDGKTYRHDHTSGTGRKSVKIDLPAKASEELAHNDLSINWKNYRKKFLKS